MSEPVTKTIIIADEKGTWEFGLQLAELLKPGDVVALKGDLGAGKTALTKAIAKGLGIQEEVTSPTFTIVREYTGGRLPLYHFDVYRLSEEAELDELGYEEYFYGKGVSVVEWADRVRSLLPTESFFIHIAYGSNELERIYQISDGEKRLAWLY